MQISQLEAVRAIARNGYNMSTAAGMLNRSQSGLSRQIKELERELGFRIFTRTRNKISGLTPQGEEVLRIGQRMLSEADDLRQLASWASSDSKAELKIGAAHGHARYTFPRVIQTFAARFPNVLLAIRELDPVACCNAVVRGEIDIAITHIPDAFADKVAGIPAFALSAALFVPKGHPLTKDRMVTLKRLAEYPLIVYPRTFAVRLTADRAFDEAGLRPQIVCSAEDADACKRYVAAGMGVAILANVAFDPVSDASLAILNADSLFQPSTVHVALRKQAYLSRSMSSFISTWAPHISHQVIRKALEGDGPMADLRLARNLPPMERTIPARAT